MRLQMSNIVNILRYNQIRNYRSQTNDIVNVTQPLSQNEAISSTMTSEQNRNKMAQMEDRCRCVASKVTTAPSGTKPNVTASSDTMGEENEPEVVIKTAINYLRRYANPQGHTLQTIGQLPPKQLADVLKDFYSTIRGHTDEMPPSFTLRYIREGLQRYFFKSCGIDIIKDKTFDFANSVFDVALRHAYTPRKCHRLRINQDDLHKIYMSEEATRLDRPDSLQNKVFFDVNMYVCNRGKDFLRVMTKTDFEVGTDVNGRKFVWLKYNPKFCFRELAGGIAENDIIAGNKIGERIYERPGDPKCPVKSFLIYLSHLHPMNDAFWQRPKRNVVQSDLVWYDNTPLGNSTISKVMQRMCQQSGITENYTNHAIRHAYSPIIEEFCRAAIQVTPTMEKCEPSPGSAADESGVGDASSASSPPRDEEDDTTIGLRPAKMKVLEMVHGLVVKDIQAFVDWLKTFRVQHDTGGLVVLCSPVDQPVSSSNDTKQAAVGETAALNGVSFQNKLQSFKGDNCGSTQNLYPLDKDSSESAFCKTERSQSISSSHQTAHPNIKTVDFQSVGETHCAVGVPFNLTIPAKDTVLLTGIQDNTQLLINQKSSLEKELPIQSRIYHSLIDGDISDLVLSGRGNGLHRSYTASDVKISVKQNKNDSKTLFESDKYKPVKKRTIHSSPENMNSDDQEPALKKQFYVPVPVNNIKDTEKSLSYGAYLERAVEMKQNDSRYQDKKHIYPRKQFHVAASNHMPDTKFVQVHGCDSSLFGIKIKQEPIDQ